MKVVDFVSKYDIYLSAEFVMAVAALCGATVFDNNIRPILRVLFVLDLLSDE